MSNTLEVGQKVMICNSTLSNAIKMVTREYNYSKEVYQDLVEQWYAQAKLPDSGTYRTSDDNEIIMNFIVKI